MNTMTVRASACAVLLGMIFWALGAWILGVVSTGILVATIFALAGPLFLAAASFAEDEEV